MEAVFNSKNLHSIAEVAAVGVVAAGVGIYEVATRHNRKHPEHNGESDN